MSFVVSTSVVVNALSEPLTHARIGYDNFVPSATVTATSAEATWPADSVQRENTFERWQPTSSGESVITIDNGTSKSADYIGIAAHTLGSSGSTLKLQQSSDGSSWFDVWNTVSPSDNSAIMIIFPEATDRYFRVVLINNSTTPQIGVIYMGMALAMQRAIYSGHTPITLSRTTTVRPTESEKGQWLGRSIVRSGLSTSYDWTRLKSAWYRANFDPFVMAARTKPFFIAWNPQDFPQETVLGWTGDDISPTNSGPRDLMSVSIGVSAYAHE